MVKKKNNGLIKRKTIKNKSKIVNPEKNTKYKIRSEMRVLAFRADPEINALLHALPNMSAFIVQALREKFAEKHFVTCPLCNGRGRITTKNAKNIVTNTLPKKKKLIPR